MKIEIYLNTLNNSLPKEMCALTKVKDWKESKNGHDIQFLVIARNEKKEAISVKRIKDSQIFRKGQKIIQGNKILHINFFVEENLIHVDVQICNSAQDIFSSSIPIVFEFKEINEL